MIFSCGDAQPEYNEIYLSFQNREYLYIYNQSENYLCVDSDIPLCQRRFILSQDKAKVVKTIENTYRFSPNDKFIISASMNNQGGTILISDDKGDIVRYNSTYWVSSTYDNSNFISSSQHTGFCDISTIDTMIKNIFGEIYSDYGEYFKSELKIDYNSMTMNPDICRLAMVLNCIADKVSLEYGNSEYYSDISSGCFYSIYSQSESVENL